MRQELPEAQIHFSATSIEMVRGILATCHVFLEDAPDEKTLWRIYRDAYRNEPFVRIVKERSGIHRYPEPKLLSGTNYCDIGFERESALQPSGSAERHRQPHEGRGRSGLAGLQPDARVARNAGPRVHRAAPDLRRGSATPANRQPPTHREYDATT